ncbi:MAG: anti-sigma factor family protein [Hyphomicrobiales bacterium]
MRWLLGPRGHGRWQQDAHAYADDELSGRERRAFEAHLRECSKCQAELGEIRRLKSALTALPEIDAPRSFRLTPDMVAAKPDRAAVPVRPRQPAWVMRAAQVTAGIAIVGLAVAATVDVLSGSDDGGNDRASDTITTMSAEAPAAAAGASGSVADNSAGSTANATPETKDAVGTAPSEPPSPEAQYGSQVPPYTPGEVGGQGFSPTPTVEPTPTPRPPASGPRNSTGTDGGGGAPTSTPEQGTVREAAPDETPGVRIESAPAQGAPAPTIDRAESSETDKRVIRSIEAGLASVALGAVILLLFARNGARKP